MPCLRALILGHRGLAMLLITAALLIKAVIPAGFKPVMDHKILTVGICTDGMGPAVTRQISIPAKDAGTHSSSKSGDCAYSALGMGALGGVDAVLVIAALAFLIILGLAPTIATPQRPVHRLRPPLRAPPALI